MNEMLTITGKQVKGQDIPSVQQRLSVVAYFLILAIWKIIRILFFCFHTSMLREVRPNFPDNKLSLNLGSLFHIVPFSPYQPSPLNPFNFWDVQPMPMHKQLDVIIMGCSYDRFQQNTAYILQSHHALYIEYE